VTQSYAMARREPRAKSHLALAFAFCACLGCGGKALVFADATTGSSTAPAAIHEAGADTSVFDGRGRREGGSASDTLVEGPAAQGGDAAAGGAGWTDGGDAAACMRDASGTAGDCCVSNANCNGGGYNFCCGEHICDLCSIR
jgi:hypothetical protein